MQRTFSVPEVSCAHCKSTIEGALLPLEGVSGASVELDSKTVLVDYEPAVVSPDRLTEAIEEVGYDVVR
ncbi:MAG: copper chaperone [Actinomycetota bacterium]|nr:copper chaperone [Actinomycetota bacterium]